MSSRSALKSSVAPSDEEVGDMATFLAEMRRTRELLERIAVQADEEDSSEEDEEEEGSYEEEEEDEEDSQ